MRGAIAPYRATRPSLPPCCYQQSFPPLYNYNSNLHLSQPPLMGRLFARSKYTHTEVRPDCFVVPRTSNGNVRAAVLRESDR